MGETFGRYTVLGQLGKGAMGVVYLAQDPLLNRQVAMKTVDLAVDDPQEREFLRNQLLRDARAAAVLKHPNIVAVYDVFEEGNRAYVVMEYVEGDSLAARLKNSPLPDATGILRVMRQASDALDYTHGKGVIHRDIKPGNIMIDNTGTTKIMDFGIARISDTRTMTPTGMVMGTVEYMAPEQILGETVDGRADQFALAVVAYQMMTGSTLFGPNSVATLTYKTVNEAPPPPSTRNALLPRGVDVVLGKALSKKPGDRFASCTEFAGALAQAFADAPTGPMAAPTAAALAAVRTQTTVVLPGGRPAPASAAAVETAPSRSKMPVVAAGLTVLVLGGILAAVVLKPWTRFQHPETTPIATVNPPATAPPEEDKAPSAARTPESAKPDVSTPSKTEPPKSEAPKPEPTKSDAAVAIPSKTEPPPTPTEASKVIEAPRIEPPAGGTPTVVPGVSKAAEAAEPVVEVEMSPPTPTGRKGGGGQGPFNMALQRGIEQSRANDYQGAIDSFSKAISLRAEAPLAYYNRGTARQHLQQYALAIQDFTQAQKLNPKMPMAYIGMGTSLVKLHRDKEAFAEFQQAMTIKPDLPQAYVGRAGIYFRARQYGPALRDYDEAVRLNPNFAQAYESRAHVREAIGDTAGAAADRRTYAMLQKK